MACGIGVERTTADCRAHKARRTPRLAFMSVRIKFWSIFRQKKFSQENSRSPALRASRRPFRSTPDPGTMGGCRKHDPEGVNGVNRVLHDLDLARNK